jgi:hypothetical protein
MNTLPNNTNWNGYILGTDCLLEHDTEGQIEGRIEVTRKKTKETI